MEAGVGRGVGAGTEESFEREHKMNAVWIAYQIVGRIIEAIFMMLALYYAKKRNLYQELYYITLAIILTIDLEMQ